MQTSFQEKELHLIIYILRFEGGTYFNDNEYEIFKQLAKNNHQSHFIFVWTRASDNKKSQKKVYNLVKESFIKMINKGIKDENKEDKPKTINTLSYLYYCQKKYIYENEVNHDDIKGKNFKDMEFYEKFELKFKGKEEEEKNKEMVSTIIDLDKNFIFANLKKDEDHEKLFGMNKISYQIIEALKNIKSFNMKI